MKMREAYEELQKIANKLGKDRHDPAVRYSIATYYKKPCDVYLCDIGHFDGLTWEAALQELKNHIAGIKPEVSPPPDEE